MLIPSSLNGLKGDTLTTGYHEFNANIPIQNVIQYVVPGMGILYAHSREFCCLSILPDSCLLTE